jgi:hypothetical protein
MQPSTIGEWYCCGQDRSLEQIEKKKKDFASAVHEWWFRVWPQSIIHVSDCSLSFFLCGITARVALHLPTFEVEFRTKTALRPLEFAANVHVSRYYS